ncbi:MAG: HTH domain-containing protein, partial [Elusimicrobia bacterium]|nr:HTH domain-containing protein [Elusimicrobiota bacterium]
MQNITKVKRIIKEIYLLKKTKHTVRDLADLFNTSVRTIQRDIKDIESLEIGELEKEKRVYMDGHTVEGTTVKS